MVDCSHGARSRWSAADWEKAKCRYRWKFQFRTYKLAECLHEIANDLTHESGTDVYHLSAQLFPLTSAEEEAPIAQDP
jgi:hypothetical protein